MCIVNLENTGPGTICQMTEGLSWFQPDLCLHWSLCLEGSAIIWPPGQWGEEFLTVGVAPSRHPSYCTRSVCWQARCCWALGCASLLPPPLKVGDRRGTRRAEKLNNCKSDRATSTPEAGPRPESFKFRNGILPTLPFPLQVLGQLNAETGLHFSCNVT